MFEPQAHGRALAETGFGNDLRVLQPAVQAIQRKAGRTTKPQWPHCRVGDEVQLGAQVFPAKRRGRSAG